MSTATKTLRTLQFRDEPQLENSAGKFAINIAGWFILEQPQLATGAQLVLQYFVGSGYKTVPVDRIDKPSGRSVLLSAKVTLPFEMRNIPFTLIATVNGCNFKVDELYVDPVLAPKDDSKRSLYAA